MPSALSGTNTLLLPTPLVTAWNSRGGNFNPKMYGTLWLSVEDDVVVDNDTARMGT